VLDKVELKITWQLRSIRLQKGYVIMHTEKQTCLFSSISVHDEYYNLFNFATQFFR